MLRKSISIVLVMLACLALAGCSMGAQDETLPVFTAPTEETQSAFPTGQRLLISAKANMDADYITITQEELGGNFDSNISYHKLSDVTIEIGGVPVKLEEAIRDGLITVEEITAYAQIDARNGICKETYSSENGLSYFVYTYADFEVEITHDIYETPDGKQHFIHEIGFYRPHGTKNISHSYIDETSQYHYTLDREDWGLKFDVTEVVPTGITLECTQSGGQQIGQLSLHDYLLFTKAGNEPLRTGTADSESAGPSSPITDIQMNATSQIHIDWENEFGTLPPGEYYMFLLVHDIYDESQVHPLMRNFTDRLRYTIIFTVE